MKSHEGNTFLSLISISRRRFAASNVRSWPRITSYNDAMQYFMVCFLLSILNSACYIDAMTDVIGRQERV